MAVAIDLSGKRGVVFGVANQRSIAWAISERLIEASEPSSRSHTSTIDFWHPCRKRSPGLEDPLLIECDATDDGDVQSVYDQVGDKWGGIDFVVHSVAYAERDDLGGDFSTTGRQGFRTALETSAYTLMPVVSRAVPLMPNGGAALTMTFDASQRVYPGYNIMGTAKAALENEVRQLAAEFGDQKRPSKRHLRRTTPNPSRPIHPRLPRHDPRTPRPLATKTQHHPPRESATPPCSFSATWLAASQAR